MKIDSLREYCKSIYELMNIPMIIYRKSTGKIEIGYFVDSAFSDVLISNPQLANRYMGGSMFSREHEVSYYVSDDEIAFGSVLDKNSDYALYIGPCLLADPSEQMMHSMLTRSNSPFRKDPYRYYDEIYSYIRKLPRFTPERFLWLLRFSANYLNQSILSDEDLTQVSLPKNRLDLKKKKLTDVSEEENGGFRRARRFIYELITLIRSGSVANALDYWDENASRFIRVYNGSSKDRDPLRHQKDLLIQFVSFLAYQVLPEGVSERQVFRLNEQLIEEADSCIITQQVEAIYRKAIQSYGELVRAHKSESPSNSALIRNALVYIHDHITEVITVPDIAEELAISPGYLSTLFNKEMKMKISDYVQSQKIAVAESLLLNTDDPIIEISEYLSFSSQSYFQNIFRKFTGTSPRKYRSSHQSR